MIAYSELAERIRRLLGDVDENNPQHSDKLVHDAILAAHRGVLPWVGKASTYAIPVDGSAKAFSLPVDLYQIVTVLDGSSDEFYPSATMSPGDYFGESMSGHNSWVEYPNGSIAFAKAPSASDDYTIYYMAYWTVPDINSEDTLLEVPLYVIQGLILFGAAQTLLQSANTSADVRQWGTRVDSGTPEHNPLQRQVDYLMKRFTQEVTKLPKTQLGQR